MIILRPFSLYRSIVFTLTTVMIFTMWELLSGLIGKNVFLGITIWTTLSIGTYRMILKTVELIIIKVPFIKRIVFGNIFLEGKWIGCYKGISGNPNYYIEDFEQDLNGLVIRGKCFDDTMFKGTWISEKVIIDDIKGKLSYTYETDMVYNTHKNQGFSVFNFLRAHASEAPNQLIGFSSDLFVGKKILSVEKKINDTHKLTDQDLLQLAKDFYNENQHLFP